MKSNFTPQKAPSPEIAVLIPCYNEGSSVAQVVADFKTHLPRAHIYVYDNNSRDDTAMKARGAGAILRSETRQGKGHVVRRMFADVEADIYILVDGDGTYDASVAPELVNVLLSGPYDVVNVARVPSGAGAYRFGHSFGNKLLTGLVRLVFGAGTDDMLSGYKGFSRRFVKSFPSYSAGFEIETELVVHALDLQLPMNEIASTYGERGSGSESKLSTYRDGLRILRLIGFLIKEERPMAFFTVVAALLAGSSIFLSIPIFDEYLRTGLVPRLPTAVLSTGLMLSAMLALLGGFVLDGISRNRRDAKRLRYLSMPAPDHASAGRD
ncbi:MAG: glycosyltransferase [Alphaproteobacteria bacterium]|nr:glycosyltransferase [Alphaproteobacteria bacterium]